ncbi:MAG: S8 family serine peptidase [Gammaproteobacteria bacterium]|nr:S8 family serine peptidase [Gammaproteobacteria bacterium]
MLGKWPKSESVSVQPQGVTPLGANIPHYETHVRGSLLAVMAVGLDGSHASYTNFCGPLPTDWDADRWGRHFCLAAPGTVNAASSWGWNWLHFDIEGTSFAAPVVSGALALLMEHFRGQLGNVEIVKRLVNTADNTGRYAQLEIYGAGLIDLHAALKPVGNTVTGTPSRHRDTAMTILSLPPAIGGLGQRLAAQGIEVASLDSWGAPFWSSPVRFMSVQPWSQPRLTPTFADPAGHSSKLHLGFTPGTVAIPARAVTRIDGAGADTLRLLKGDGRIGIEQAPSAGFRWGVLRDNSSWLGGFPSGAFGNNVRSSTAWFGRSARFEFDHSWAVTFSGTLALARVDLPSGAMLDVEPHLMSTWDIAVERGVRGVGKWSRLSLTQPLRAETGNGKLTYLAGLKDGAPTYNHAVASLAPRGREVELAFTHETPIGAGRAVFRIARSYNFLHQRGQADSSIGFAYRVRLP